MEAEKCNYIHHPQATFILELASGDLRTLPGLCGDFAEPCRDFAARSLVAEPYGDFAARSLAESLAETLRSLAVPQLIW